MKDNSCKGLFGLIFGHKYVARYNIENTTPISVSTDMKDAVATLVGSIGGYVDVLHEHGIAHLSRCFSELQSNKSTYIQDVCSRCGKVIND